MSSTMTITKGDGEAPNIVLHSFVTESGVARPLRNPKKNQSDAICIRRTHKKSRNGCTRCKARRIKCDELKPDCSNCVQRGLSCAYPETFRSAKLENGSDVEEISPVPFPSLTSDTFTLQDLQIFHHFLIKATPHLPVGNQDVWAKEIPQFALHNQYLMHSVLAFGASHLGRLLDVESFEVQALTYRVRGLDGLRKAMSKESWEYGDTDSILAGCYALLLQSLHIDDGISDLFSLLRLAESITSTVRENGNILTEFDLRPDKAYEAIQPYLHVLPFIEPELLSSGIEALEQLRPILRDEAAIKYCNALQNILKAHQASPAEGYFAFGLSFVFWLDLSEAQYKACIDPSNTEIQLLLSYFIAIMLLMMPFSVLEHLDKLEWLSTRHMKGLLSWARKAWEKVPSSLHMFLEYPKAIVASATLESEAIPVCGPSVLQLDKIGQLTSVFKELKLKEVKSSTL